MPFIRISCALHGPIDEAANLRLPT